MTVRTYKSRSFRKTFKKSPSGISKFHYRRKNPKGSFCGITGAKLNGIPKLRPGKFNNLSKTKKRPNRKYGGTFSHSVVKQRLENSIFEQES